MPKQEWPPEMGREMLIAAGQFLLDRLDEFERDCVCDTVTDAREWIGHVAPAIARFRAALTAAERVVGEDEVDAAAKRIVASRNLPDGCEINWEQFKADARNALALPTPDRQEHKGE